jgi:hypothetical protein
MRLRQFAKREGHLNVPGNYKTEDGFNLGQWVRNQRSKYSIGKLSMKQQILLEKIPQWIWSINRATWVRNFKRLSEYVKREGNARVPVSYVEKDGFKLGQWVMSQREIYKHQRLFRERQRMLEQLLGWVWRPRKDHQRNEGGKSPTEQQKGFTTGWAKSLERLHKYSVDEGHACVPSNYVTEDGYKLGTWVRDQRYQHEKGRRRLSKEQEQALEQLPGWIWNAQSGRKEGKHWSKNMPWWKAYDRLSDYVEQSGHAIVPFKYIAKDGYRLGIWVCTQRALYRKGALSQERQLALEQLPDWSWNARKTINKNDG